MPTERRTESEIRREIAAEREQLAAALGDLRASVEAKRRPAARIGVIGLAAVAAAILARVVRRL